MALSLDPATQVISIPKADLTLVSGTLYELDTNQFRKNVMALLDDEDYIWMPNAFIHNTAVTVAGTTLSRTLEFINGYSIEFEDGAYTVRLAGSNNNIFDVENGILVQNSVQVIAQNSAGLVEAPALEYSDYNLSITIDVINGESGIDYPIGTARRPVNNLIDATSIAVKRGFRIINVRGDLTVSTGDNIDSYTLRGESPDHTTLTIDAAASTINSQFENATVTGTLDGGSRLINCDVNTLSFVDGTLYNCVFNDTITLSGVADLHALNCFSGVIGSGTPTINFNGSGSGAAIRNYNGGISLMNKSGSESVSIDIGSGQVVIDSTCTSGAIIIRGIAKLTDNSLGATVVTDGLLNTLTIADQVWNEGAAEHTTLGSMADVISKVRKIVGNRLVVDRNAGSAIVYDDDGTTPLYTINPFPISATDSERGAI